MAQQPTRRLSRRKKLLFAVIVLVAGVVSLEVGLRVLGLPAGLVRSFSHLWNPHLDAPDAPPGLFRPSFQGRVGYPPELAYDVSFNTLGLRGPETTLAPEPGVVRVLALGDSVTFGYHVPDADSYPALLRARFADQPVEVINAGCGHFTITDQRAYLEERLLRLEPDVVVLQFCSNDVQPQELDRDPTLYAEIAHATPPGPLSAFGDWLRASTALGEAQLRLAIALKRWRKGPQAALGAPDVPTDPAVWARYRAELEQLRDLLRARQIPLVLLSFTDLWTVEADGPSTLDAQLAELAAGLEIPFVTPLDAFRAVDDPKTLYHWPLDAHPSAAGNALLADAAHAALLELEPLRALND